MKLFKRKKENKLAAYNGVNPLTVSVPDIKGFLVQEFERSKGMQSIIDDLEEKLEIANEVKIKYDAAMVTIDEYSKRLDAADDKIFKAQEKLKEEREDHAITRDEFNSLKIRLNDAALTKAQIKNEIVREIKREIIAAIKAHKGALSKTSACEIVDKAKLPKGADNPNEEGSVQE